MKKFLISIVLYTLLLMLLALPHLRNSQEEATKNQTVPSTTEQVTASTANENDISGLTTMNSSRFDAVNHARDALLSDYGVATAASFQNELTQIMRTGHIYLLETQIRDL